ncbi:hypothetical protein [Actinoplanes auranticolor]|uniref:hypothetical protein n=1 Tax=Actinoplanes auranticolor TaxID=47988 RepID=UPI0031F13422
MDFPAVVDFAAADFPAADFAPADFPTVDFADVDFPAAVEFAAVDLAAAEDFPAAEDLPAVVAFAPADFTADDFAPMDFAAVEDLAAAEFAAVEDLAAAPERPAAAFVTAEAEADLVAGAFFAVVLLAGALLPAPDLAAETGLAADRAAPAEVLGLTADRTVTDGPAAEPAAAVRLAAAGLTAAGWAAAGDAATRALLAPVVAARVGAFLGTAMGKFLLANDCGLVSAWRLQDSGLDTGVEPA